MARQPVVLLYVNEEQGLAGVRWQSGLPSQIKRAARRPTRAGPGRVLTLPSVILQGIKLWLNVCQCLMLGIRTSTHHFTGSRMFHETLTPLTLICLLLAAGPLSAADRLVDGVPLPEDARAAIVAETDPTELRQWAGAWVGAWGGRLKHVLLVESVTTEGLVQVVYAIGWDTTGLVPPRSDTVRTSPDYLRGRVFGDLRSQRPGRIKRDLYPWKD